jgi:hypothetical protein
MPLNPITGQEAPTTPNVVGRVVGRKLIGSDPHAVPRLRAQVEALKQCLLAAGVTDGVVQKVLDEAEEPFQ